MTEKVNVHGDHLLAALPITLTAILIIVASTTSNAGAQGLDEPTPTAVPETYFPETSVPIATYYVATRTPVRYTQRPTHTRDPLLYPPPEEKQTQPPTVTPMTYPEPNSKMAINAPVGQERSTEIINVVIKTNIHKAIRTKRLPLCLSYSRRGYICMK